MHRCYQQRTLIALAVCIGFAVNHIALAGEAEDAAVALEQVKANTPPEQVDRIFTRFCLANFGAEKEPLVYEKFGKDLKFIAKGSWRYVSVSSATVAFETNLPAYTQVEYGQTEKYGALTPKPERLFYIHVHYLKGLKPETVYHYRTIGTDERGNKIVSEDKTFKTSSAEKTIALPGDLPGPPYKLDKANTTYIVTGDFTAKGTAIEIHAPGITLDLGGNTVTYADEKTDREVFTDKWLSFMHKGSFGVKNIGHSDIKLVNGIIRQGKGDNRGNNESTGFNAVYLRKLSNIEFAGVTFDYWTPQIAGIRMRYCEGKMNLHHSVFLDRGTKMHNRHGQGCSSCSSIGCRFTESTIHHTLVKRTRQNGLRPKHKLYNNEIYVDSWSTNSFASGIGNGGESFNNRIFCTGYHAISCPWGNGIKVHDNLIHMEGINTGKTRWWEGFGDQNSMNGLRHTQWGKNRTRSENSEYSNNLVVIGGRNGAQIRGVEFFTDAYIRNLVLRDSIVKIVARDAKTSKAGCVATQGSHGRRELHLPATYKNCRFISNINNLRLGDDYGRGDNHFFINCSFEKIGERKDHHTIAGMASYFSGNHAIRDCTFKGCDVEDVDWGKAGPRSYRVQWSLTVKAPAGSSLTITDKSGAVSFKGATGVSGCVIVPLTAFSMSNHPKPGKTVFTPHKLVVTSPKGDAKDVTLMINKAQEYALPGAPAANPASRIMTIHARKDTRITIRDKDGKEYVSGVMGPVGSIAVPLPAKQDFTISGTHADGEAFEETMSLNEALTYTVPNSKKSIAALEAREKSKKKSKKK